VLKLRIITALVLIPVFVLSVLYMSTIWFAAFMAIIMALAAWEWAGIIGYKQLLQRSGYVMLIALILGAAFRYRLSPLLCWASIIALFWWLCAAWMVVRYQRQQGLGFHLVIPGGTIGVLVLVPAWLSLIMLHADEPEGIKLVLFLLVLIWSADIAAYFCGRRWGKNKLCDQVSPGKSWEGVFGALFAATIVALTYGLSQSMDSLDILIFVPICLLTVMASVLGDLLESLIKRLGEVKDSGSILPGHGGVLDRIDSLTAALPVFLSALYLWEASK
jgi:phosphatidate cytidylyltransferase